MENIPILEQLQQLAGQGNFTLYTSFGNVVSNVVGLLLILAAVATFIYLILGGIKWITAGGDKGKVEEAKSQLTNAVIGLAIVAASWAVFLILDYFFGLGLAGASNSPGGSTATNVGFCSCGNGLCRYTNTYTGRGDANGQCYYCHLETGQWRTVAGDNSCSDDPLVCQPCRQPV